MKSFPLITAFSPSISLLVGEILNEMVSTLLQVLAAKAGASSSFVNSIIIRLQRLPGIRRKQQELP